ncbi:flavin-containing monooxygenase [Oricola nitratireducens]|uniref:flavin-containing monooxygenase n=1 Tax=Oricola nitratireducens TaxID=2775868 RepID=UPI001FEDA560|nr:NAD(P)/FAD-dependent oxidoreductase [Oricola nitratireducens]
MQPMTDVAIVGAGAAGLATAFCLRQAGISVRLLEKSHEIAGPWRKRHPQLRLNTHRDLSQLPGLKMPKDAGTFPSRDTLIRYLEDYARNLDLPVEFGVEVTALERAGEGWRLETGSGPVAAKHVVIATGREATPFIPDWPGRGDYEGRLIHAADFGDADQYAGKNVLVVGAGNSGSDILNHLSRVDTQSVLISIRKGSVVFPAFMFGVPMQRLAPLLELLPLRAIDWMLRDTERMAFGNLRQYGFPVHPDGGATRMATDGVSPAIDNGFVAAVKAGRMRIVPEVGRFRERMVVLADGTRIAPDVVIAATGYRTGLEPLLGHLDVLNSRGVPRIDGAQTLPHAPGLWCIGMRPTMSGYFRAASRNGRAIASTISADLARRPAHKPVAAAAVAGAHA